MAMPTIRTMRPQDVRLALDWARQEGWNPGLDDAEAFLNADPSGFLMGWLDNTPVTAISVVRHAPDFAFLGLYLCRPEHRGKGYGWDIWQAGMALAGGRTVGLDGVQAQQANYAKSGFTLSHATVRHHGVLTGAADARISPLSPAQIAEAVTLDAAITGLARSAYTTGWFSDSATRKTFAMSEAGRITGLISIRTCGQGAKIGPLLAPDAPHARALILHAAQATGQPEVMIDCPDRHHDSVDLSLSLGLKPVFETARMYKGSAPEQDRARLFAECTLELG